MFYDIYRARGRDSTELTTLARKHGYDNPGPIAAFPPNQTLFPASSSPGSLPSGARILVPWHPNILRKLIATQEYLATEIANNARGLIEDVHASKESLEHFLMQVDAACMLANVGKGIGELVVHGVRHGEMTASQLVTWFVNSRLEMASDLTTLVVPAPSEPKKDFRFYIRHALGPWTPSFWTAVYVAVKTGDVNTYLYGPMAVEYQTKLQIKHQADADISRLKAKIVEAKQQLAMPFYKTRL